MDSTFKLEFNKILELLSEQAVSEKARQKLLELKPSLNESECFRLMRETTQARLILENLGTPPLAVMKDLDQILELCSKGSMLTPEQLMNIAHFLFTCRKMKNYLKKAESDHAAATGNGAEVNGIAYYGGSISALNELYEEIDRSVRNGMVDDSASPKLRDLRRKIENGNSQIKSRLEAMLRNKKEWFTDGYVSTRNGHFVLPVKREYKNLVSGSVVDTSSSGGTCFIEPSSVRKMEEELSVLHIEEENEIRRILYTLTALVDEQMQQIRINAEVMEELDYCFSKAKLSLLMKAIPAPVTAQPKIVIRSGRHPLLKKENCVPLNFELGNEITGVVITGPNTGGKTVALKTVGLLSMMAQSGLEVPAGEGSSFSMRNLYLCDIGDGQSITENLSTFSSHITNIIEILRSATDESLVLLDELGSGTDPAEGMGIAVAVLDELRRKKCLFVATTHYPEIKEYARNTPGLVNARMAFDRESLCPLYRLEMGEAGESCALYIAKRLGFPEHLLEIAQSAAYRNGRRQDRSVPVEIPLNEGATVPAAPSESPKIQKGIQSKPVQPRRSDSFNRGDCVLVYPKKETGIVYQTSNERGEIGVQIKKEKYLISYKRLKLQVPASELYPPDYDFSVVFDTVANRKARRVMEKRHDPNAVIEISKGHTDRKPD